MNLNKKTFEIREREREWDILDCVKIIPIIHICQFILNSVILFK